MNNIEQTVQNKLVADYRKSYPWAAEFSDEELALLCPVSDEDIKAFIVGKRSQVITHMAEVDDKILDVKEKYKILKMFWMIHARLVKPNQRLEEIYHMLIIN